MPYVGQRVQTLFRPGPTRVLLRRMADKGGGQFVDLTARNTPIDTGNLRTAWYQKPVYRTRKFGTPAYETGVTTDVEYAPYVEWGTGLYGPRGSKYPILPKQPGGTLSWISPKTGQRVFAKKVMHPGSAGQHMVALAAAKLEAEFPHLFVPELARWRRDIEMSVRR